MKGAAIALVLVFTLCLGYLVLRNDVYPTTLSVEAEATIDAGSAPCRNPRIRLEDGSRWWSRVALPTSIQPGQTVTGRFDGNGDRGIFFVQGEEIPYQRAAGEFIPLACVIG